MNKRKRKMVENDSKSFKYDFSLSSFFNDEHVLFHIAEYCNNEQIHKWTHVCSSLRSFVQSHFPEHFLIDPSKNYFDEYQRLCSEGNIKAIKYLNSKNIVPFPYSIEYKNLDILKFLYSQYSVDIHQIAIDFDFAVNQGDLQMVNFLFSQIPNKTNEVFIQILLSICCKYGYLNLIQFFDSKGIFYDKMMVLFEACKHGHLHIVKYLVFQGTQIPKDSTLLIFASESANLDLIQYLISQGVLMGDKKEKMLVKICKKANLKTFQFIYSQGVNMNEQLMSKMISYLAMNQDLSIFQYLVSQYKILLNPYHLYLACLKGNLPFVKYLISQGVKFTEILKPDEFSQYLTPLAVAIEFGYYDLFVFLIENNVDSFISMEECLNYACRKERINMIKYLILSKKVPFEKRHGDKFLSIPHLLTLENIQFFVSQGLDIHQDKENLLNYACSKGNLPLVKYLVSQGADISNDNPLFMAMTHSHLNVIKYLIFKRFQKSVTNSFQNPPTNLSFLLPCPLYHDIVEFLTTCDPNFKIDKND